MNVSAGEIIFPSLSLSLSRLEFRRSQKRTSQSRADHVRNLLNIIRAIKIRNPDAIANADATALRVVSSLVMTKMNSMRCLESYRVCGRTVL